jgi:hypothetical protein
MQYDPGTTGATVTEALPAPPRSASKLSGSELERHERGIHAYGLMRMVPE